MTPIVCPRWWLSINLPIRIYCAVKEVETEKTPRFFWFVSRTYATILTFKLFMATPEGHSEGGIGPNGGFCLNFPKWCHLSLLWCIVFLYSILHLHSEQSIFCFVLSMRTYIFLQKWLPKMDGIIELENSVIVKVMPGNCLTSDVVEWMKQNNVKLEYDWLQIFDKYQK